MTYSIITASLVARTAIHLGSGQESGVTDALIRRDGSGRPLIPGTALAGALRAMLTRLGPRLAGVGLCVALQHKAEDKAARQSCQCGVCRLFGDINPSDDSGSHSTASKVLVFNAQLAGEPPPSAVRDGVGINRTTGAAARAGAVKFDLEVLPAGATFTLRLELRNQDAQDEALLAAGLAEWQAGRAWLGGRVGRGLGAFALQELTFAQLDLNQTDTLLAFLGADEPAAAAQPLAGWLADRLGQVTVTASPSPFAARRWFEVTATLQAGGPLLTNDTTTAGLTGFDHAPLLLQWGNWQKPVLTGAGLRGVMRSHAERLARTLATLEAADGPAFLQACPACSPVESRDDKPLTSCDQLLKARGVDEEKEVEDGQLCLACRLFGSTRRGSRLLIEDAPYNGPGQPRLKMLDFLAVDRFTGGGADGAKFDALALWQPTFAFRLHLDNPERWELAWLALVLRDLQAGWLAVGMGAAKGFGRVKLADLSLQVGYLAEADVTDLGLSPQPGHSSGLYQVRPLTLPEASPWLADFRQMLTDFSRPAELALTADSYFTTQIEPLYPKEVTL